MTTQFAAPEGGPELSGAPAEVAGRYPLSYCGVKITSLGDTLVFEDLIHSDQTAQCFGDGVATGVPTEMISVDYTIEGDAIVSIVRFLASGNVELFVDSTRDNNGPRSWMVYQCDAYDPFRGEPRGCGAMRQIDAAG